MSQTTADMSNTPNPGDAPAASEAAQAQGQDSESRKVKISELPPDKQIEHWKAMSRANEAKASETSRSLQEMQQTMEQWKPFIEAEQARLQSQKTPEEKAAEQASQQTATRVQAELEKTVLQPFVRSTLSTVLRTSGMDQESATQLSNFIDAQSLIGENGVDTAKVEALIALLATHKDSPATGTPAPPYGGQGAPPQGAIPTGLAAGAERYKAKHHLPQ